MPSSFRHKKPDRSAVFEQPLHAHTLSGEQVLSAVESSLAGLSAADAAARAERFGINELPQPPQPGIAIVIIRQFASPLIYVLIAAALLATVIEEWSDAAFITAVLLINALIGSIQEYSAQRAAQSLRQLIHTGCRVLRDGESYELDAGALVPGDMIHLESGDRVPADVRLIHAADLEVDESLLTGESVATLKDASLLLGRDDVVGDRRNMAFAGTMVIRGRGQGVVVATAMATELGRIAADVLNKPQAKAPLLVRMERFTKRIAIFIGLAAVIVGLVALSRGAPLQEIFLLTVALAVSAIPEGLPVALTVALAIGMRRMARRGVIVRRLIAVEALGSCTFVATDKTGTLTINELTVRRILFPDGKVLDVSGQGMVPDGRISSAKVSPAAAELAMFRRLATSAVLANEGFLGRRGEGWAHHGDAVDVALLVMAHKGDVIRGELLNQQPEMAAIPFESERLFAASLNGSTDDACICVKGAVEKLLPMCARMITSDGDRPIDRELIQRQAIELASDGYRMIGFASGHLGREEAEASPHELDESQLHHLTFLGMAAMIDPLRPDAKTAVERCRRAGIEVAMVTGDHPVTALAIARELKLVEHESQIVTGHQLRMAEDPSVFAGLVAKARVFARVEPKQKLQIVVALQQMGHFVAVSGDGANDAPALKAAEVGVAMGKSSTDVARETAELIITDDHFGSIVAGVEEGRVAYANVRKVILLLISTGAAELVLFTLALIANLPLPLLAVHLLWLNLVTNGIQDVALALEPEEGHELRHPPRPPDEPVFNRAMIEQVLIGALVIGALAFALFRSLLAAGLTIDEARNSTLLLMVLFENVHVFNCRSESQSVFTLSPLRNRILLVGTLSAQLIHIAAMYHPWISQTLHIQPVAPGHWVELLLIAFSVLLPMEIYKRFRKGARR